MGMGYLLFDFWFLGKRSIRITPKRRRQGQIHNETSVHGSAPKLQKISTTARNITTDAVIFTELH
jgi:hypothetical protein